MTGKSPGKPRYFICRLTDESRAPNYLRKDILPPISIELDAPEGGLSGKSTYFDLHATAVVIDGHAVPQENQRKIKGDAARFALIFPIVPEAAVGQAKRAASPLIS
jgi:hypothetical protein